MKDIAGFVKVTRISCMFIIFVIYLAGNSAMTDSTIGLGYYRKRQSVNRSMRRID
jgi:hypothetical protein